MPAEYNFYAFLGAAVIGVISAAGMYIYGNIKQEKNRHAMARDVGRLDKEVARLKKELELLSKKDRSPKVKKRTRASKANSIISNSTIDGYLSAAGSTASNYDSSDLEFYDISDDEIDTLDHDSTSNLEKNLQTIDIDLNSDRVSYWEIALGRLQDLSVEYPKNPEILWRIGKACHKLSEVETEEMGNKYITKGVKCCKEAVELKWDNPDVHKWYAILIGSRSQMVSLQERISDGHLFKKHIDIAISLSPKDGSLYHLLGRFDYEVASLKWYERKVAATLFAEPPNATYEEALSRFLRSEELTDFDWKENKLFIAKCKIAMGDYREAVDWLEQANNCQDDNFKTDSEIKELMETYKNYR